MTSSAAEPRHAAEAGSSVRIDERNPFRTAPPDGLVRAPIDCRLSRLDQVVVWGIGVPSTALFTWAVPATTWHGEAPAPWFSLASLAAAALSAFLAWCLIRLVSLGLGGGYRLVADGIEVHHPGRRIDSLRWGSVATVCRPRGWLGLTWQGQEPANRGEEGLRFRTNAGRWFRLAGALPRSRDAQILVLANVVPRQLDDIEARLDEGGAVVFRAAPLATLRWVAIRVPFARVVLDERGLSRRSLRGTLRLRWDEVERCEAILPAKLVLRSRDRRLVLGHGWESSPALLAYVWQRLADRPSPPAFAIRNARW